MTDALHGVEGYFAYGANMDPAVLDRRGLRPLEARPGRLDDHALSFTAPGLPLIEPGFATVHEAPGEVVHGVFYAMNHDDLVALDAFEHDQERFAVTVHTATGPVRATTYRCHSHRDGLVPSRRYLGIVVRGARLHQLPDDWVRWLEERPTAYLPGVSELFAASLWAFERLLQATRRR